MNLPTNYEILKTNDGSPTLSFNTNSAHTEPMHNLQGAFTENLYIYGANLERGLKSNFASNYLSVGLGLGYNELMITAFSLKHGLSQLNLLSFESEEFLRVNFMGWLNSTEVDPSLSKAYDTILELCSQHFKLGQDEIKSALLNFFKEQQFILSGALSKNSIVRTKYNHILYDAYSEKTSPELWNEDFLNYFLENYCEPDCVFSTYAAKGVLNRALKNNDFLLEKRDGFQGKRQSTFALRDHSRQT